MTLIHSISPLLLVLVITATTTALGFRTIELVGLPCANALDSTLFACAIGYALIGFAVFALSTMGWLKPLSAWCLIALAAGLAGRGWVQLRTQISDVAMKVRSLNGVAVRMLSAGIVLLATLEALVAMAPLTGSDAMHYHFTVPLLELGKPLSPIFSLTHSFLVGEAHWYISLGLALGSARISLGFIYLGGLLTGAALFSVARKLMPVSWSLLAVLTFLISPLVFWQITTSGCPDIWMGSFTGVAVIAAAEGIETANTRLFILAGFFAGMAAGVKYTGWIVPIAVCLFFLLHGVSLKKSVICGLTALAAGGLPLVRNLVWTGDPFFPFLLRWIKSNEVNAFALNSLIHDTRSSAYSLSLVHLLRFPLDVILRGDTYGLGQYFGPTVLAFAPLLLFIKWNSPLVKLSATICGAMFLANALTAQMARFLLPVYILALVLVFSGLAAAAERKWRTTVHACVVALAFFFAFAGGADALYSRSFLPVVIGEETNRQFLEAMAPDYEYASFVNETLGDSQRAEGGRVMVFFRHLYYLRIPFVNGDPANSWLANPGKFDQPDALLHALHELDVKWVVKSPNYPLALESAFNQLEREKKLAPIATGNFQSFTGNSRIYREKISVRITILKVAE